jgi:hypothetical protein
LRNERGSTIVSSPNPGVSAAGEAAGRADLNPATGPAAIGGMLVPGPEPSAQAVLLQCRLTSAVSDITKLADILRTLSVDAHRGAELTGPPLGERSGGGVDPWPTLPAAGPSGESNNTHRRFGLGATAAVTHNVSGYTAPVAELTDGHHPPASHNRI